MKEILGRINNELSPFGAKLVAVSKTRSADEILSAYESGQRIFGENYVQELVTKQPLLPDSISWHFIGHLQSNKVKSIVSFVSCIQTVDSEKLLKEIEKEAGKVGRIIDCFLQVHIAREATKFGLSYDEAGQLLQWHQGSGFSHTRISGLMGMATNTDDTAQVRNEFKALHDFFQAMKVKHPDLKELSMGMSGDYRIALEEGSTMIRIGSAIFGERDYSKKA